MPEVELCNNETSNPLVKGRDSLYTCAMSTEQMCFQYSLLRLVGGCLYTG